MSPVLDVQCFQKSVISVPCGVHILIKCVQLFRHKTNYHSGDLALLQGEIGNYLCKQNLAVADGITFPGYQEAVSGVSTLILASVQKEASIL